MAHPLCRQTLEVPERNQLGPSSPPEDSRKMGLRAISSVSVIVAANGGHSPRALPNSRGHPRAGHFTPVKLSSWHTPVSKAPESRRLLTPSPPCQPSARPSELTDTHSRKLNCAARGLSLTRNLLIAPLGNRDRSILHQRLQI